MKFSVNWLREFVELPANVDELAELLTLAGTEIESIEKRGANFDQVVVAQIKASAQHPNADRLSVCQVDDGSGQERQIVCGAKNYKVNDKVPLALPGAVLVGDLKIKPSKLRGVESQGMLCSPSELGLSADSDGLLILSPDAKIGEPIASLFPEDTILDVEITPNRGDLLSHFGLAREISALVGQPLRLPGETAAGDAPVQQKKGITISAPNECPFYSARRIENIKVGPSPDWLRGRLEAVGLRSINNIVDITNFVMLEIGQPLHAFDADKLSGGISVRLATVGEKFLALDGKTYSLGEQDLVIADDGRAVGLAGVMGGEDTGVTDSTTTLLLESAFFEPAVIAGKSRVLGFGSESAYRFERGVDFGGCARAVERATGLIIAVCGGRAGPLTDVTGPLPRRDPVKVRPERVTRILGLPLGDDVIADAFTRLGFAYERAGADFIVTPPTYRFDLAIEEDFVEEVARMYGYDNISPTPAAHVQHMLPLAEAQRSAADLRRRLVARDWQEIVTFSFVSAATEALLDPAAPAERTPIRVLNPIAAHLDVMRTTMLPGLVATLASNLSHKAPRVRVFEIGRVFGREGAGFSQPLVLGGLAYGSAAPEQWGEKVRTVDFFDIKGDLEALAAPRQLATEAAPQPWLHPGRAATVRIDGADCGFVGELHPRLARHYGFPQAPVVFQVELAPLLAGTLPEGRPVARFPIVRRDLAVIVDEALPAAAVIDALHDAAPLHVERIVPFDVYRGAGLPSGRKSLAILVLMQDTARTLTDADIDATVAALVEVLKQRFGATLRQ